MQEFFGMSYPEAVSYLLDGEQGQIIERGKRQETKRKPARAGKGRQAVDKEQTEERKEPKEPKELKPPEKNPTMKRVYAYLLQKRGSSSVIIWLFLCLLISSIMQASVVDLPPPAGDVYKRQDICLSKAYEIRF